MGKIIGGILISILFISMASAEELRIGPEVGNLAPEFTFQNAQGKWVSLSDFRGKKVFIFSWSSWCRCKYQLPELEEFYLANKSDNFEVVTVASDSMGFKWAQEYLDAAKATFTALVDPNNELALKYDFLATENGFLIDEAGVIRMRKIGFYIYDETQRAELVELMKKDFGSYPQKSEGKTLDDKIAAAQDALKAEPGSVELAVELAELHRVKGDLETAEKVLAQTVKKHKLSALAHYRLGVILYQRGQIEAGVEQWRIARMLAPFNYIYMRNIQAYKKPEKFYGELME